MPTDTRLSHRTSVEGVSAPGPTTTPAPKAHARLSEQAPPQRDGTSSPELGTLNWCLIIVLLMVCQYVLTSWTGDFGNDPNVVSHVGFAGTLISIILAVLAIIYAFYQSYSQTRTADAIGSQVEVLRRTVEEIQASTSGLTVELQRLDDVREKLDETVTLGRTSGEEVRQIRSRLEAMTSIAEVATVGAADAPAMTERSVTPREMSSDDIEHLLAKLSTLVFGALYAAAQPGARSLTWAALAAKYAVGVQQLDASQKVDEAFLEGLAGGALLGSLGVLRRLGLVTDQEDRDLVPILDERFAEAIRERAAKFPGKEGSKRFRLLQAVEAKFQEDVEE